MHGHASVSSRVPALAFILTAQDRPGANLDQHGTRKVRVVCTQLPCFDAAFNVMRATVAAAESPAFYSEEIRDAYASEQINCDVFQ